MLTHANASAEQLRAALAEAREVLAELRSSPRDDYVPGHDAKTAERIHAVGNGYLRQHAREVERLEYELKCLAGLERSGFALGQAVVCGPRWTMGAQPGWRNGEYVHDNGTGERGHVCGSNPDGSEIRIREDEVGYDWIPITRLLLFDAVQAKMRAEGLSQREAMEAMIRERDEKAWG